MKKTVLNAVLGMGIGAAFVISSGVQAQCCSTKQADTTKKACFTQVDKDQNATATCEERTAYCKKTHSNMDANNDGKVSKDEYMDNEDKTFTARDANADGFIVIEEYIVVPAEMDTAKIKEEKKKIEDKNGKDATKKIDSNSDQNVTVVEYVVFFYTRLDDADTDKDGKVSKDEFKQNAETRFQKADKNNDGIIEEDELIESWYLAPEKK